VHSLPPRGALLQYPLRLLTIHPLSEALIKQCESGACVQKMPTSTTL
jgi:hypothetical protein